MLFTLEPLQASEGDCLLLHWGTKQDPKLAVIDGGPGQTYENHLLPRLEQIRTKRKLAQLPIELVMVSHMDSDHVVGVKKAYAALKRVIQKNLPASHRVFEFKRLWHNVFNDVLGDPIDAYYKTLTASVQASANGKPGDALVDGLAKQFEKRLKLKPRDAEHAAYEVGLVLAGHGDGRQLRDDQQFLHDQGLTATLNTPFKKHGKPTLITADGVGKVTKVAGLAFQIVGPAQDEIERLQTEFDAYIKKHQLTVESVLAAYADESIKNLSSIVCLVSAGKKKILLTGDARGDKILDGLRAAKLIKGKQPLEVDVLKVPHHGSDRNAEPEFFERIIADHYVLSGDGKHGNPERDTLEWIVGSRGKQERYDIYLTYAIEEIDERRKHEADKLFKKKKGPKWQAKRHSLRAFFDAHEGHKFTVHETAPFKIELGDETIGW